MVSITANIQIVQDKIEQACKRIGRDTEEINVIAVTKYVNVEKTEEVLNAGLQHIGENRPQQAVSKYDQLQERGIWHFIGNLQTRKVKQVIGKFEYIHSLDRIALAEEIEKRAKYLGIKVKCFIQVNVSGEESKSGIDPDKLIQFSREVKQFESIEVVGLMTMAPLTENIEVIRPHFRRLRELRDYLNEQQIFDYLVKELSMGMSNDFEIAIEEGATFVRLGSILLK